MYPEIVRVVDFKYPLEEVLAAIIKICSEKAEYELLEEVSEYYLQIFVKHYSEILKKDTGYYLNLTLEDKTENIIQLKVEAQKGVQELSTSAYFDINNIIKEFLFILRQYLHLTNDKS